MNQSPLTIPAVGDPLVDIMLPQFSDGGKRAFFALCGNDLPSVRANSSTIELRVVAERLYPVLFREQVGATVDDIVDALTLRSLMLIDDEMVELQAAAARQVWA